VIKPWWERYPGLLEEELASLEQAGMPAIVDEGWKAQGIIRLEFTYAADGEEIPLVAIYPDLYPYIRPEVRAPDLDLPRHQNPFARNLCLIGRATANWTAFDRTLAELVTTQIPKLLLAARRPEGTPSPVPEDPQGEPVTDFYEYYVPAMIVIDSADLIPASAGSGSINLVLDVNGDFAVRGYVRDIEDRHGHRLGGLDLVGTYPKGAVVRGRWIRLSEPPRAHSAHEMLALVTSTDSGLASERWDRVGTYQIDVVGIVFPEELRQDVVGDGWIFLVRVKGSRGNPTYLARTGRGGREDLAERIPELRGLRDKKVLAVGLGGIGAPSALEFLRAGVGEVRAADRDIVDPGVSIRWPFGFAYIGEAKVEALARFAKANYPYTKVVPFHQSIGATRDEPGQPSQLGVLDEMLDGVDLVYDATAEVGLHFLLSELARERGIPYVEAWTKNGAWGGVIGRVLPGEGKPCWTCYAFALEDLDATIAVKPGGFHQPAGCADPTFTGAGFDVAAFALEGTRLAIATLLREEENGYPDPDWDFAIINIRGEASMSDQSRTTHTLSVHPSCTRRIH
jgi:molybdopterin/thiamine biosynthesis adenylyltransferase